MAQPSQPEIPVSWPERLATTRQAYRQDSAWAEGIAQEIARLRPPISPGIGFSGPAVVVAAKAIIDGPEPCRAILAPLMPLVPRALADLANGVAERVLPALSVLSFLNGARCCGHPLPPPALGVEGRWLPELTTRADRLAEHERHTAALAALAAGLPRLVAAFVQDRTGPARFAPQQTFGFNVPGFALYLAAGLEAGASYLDVEPAWLDVVHRFPYKLAARTLDWPDLLWAARAVMTRFEAVPEGEVAARLHRLVTAGGRW